MNSRHILRRGVDPGGRAEIRPQVCQWSGGHSVNRRLRRNFRYEKLKLLQKMKRDILTRIYFNLPDNGNEIICYLINATKEEVNYVINNILKQNSCLGKVELEGDNIFYYGKENNPNPIGKILKGEWHVRNEIPSAAGRNGIDEKTSG